MREAILGKLVQLLAGQTPEQLARSYRLLTGQPWPDSARVSPTSQPKQPSMTGPFGAGGKPGPAYVFRWTGRDWEVECGGGKAFHLPNILGCRYLDYLLHHPNEPIAAFDLEVAITPEKGEARGRTSIQPESDPRALAEYREDLRQVQAERREVEAAGGDVARLEALDNEVAALEAALTGSDAAADTGQRAFDNVRKAVGAVRKHLRQGTQEEQAFEAHLHSQLSIGHQCLYSAPGGRVWD